MSFWTAPFFKGFPEDYRSRVGEDWVRSFHLIEGGWENKVFSESPIHRCKT